MDYTVHGILQAGILQWVAIPFSRDLPNPGIEHSTTALQANYHLSHQGSPNTEFFRQEYWSGLSFPSPGDLPNPGIEPRAPTLQVDSLLAEPQGSPRILEWAAYPFSRGSSRPRNWTGVSYIAGGFFTSWATRETQINVRTVKLFTRLLQLSNSRTFFIGTQKEKKPWTH